jgi:hypothetical protein
MNKTTKCEGVSYVLEGFPAPVRFAFEKGLAVLWLAASRARPESARGTPARGIPNQSRALPIRNPASGFEMKVLEVKNYPIGKGRSPPYLVQLRRLLVIVDGQTL